MSILNVNKINPVGGGSTITIAGIASVTGSVTATGTITGEHHGDASNLTGLPAANLTGTLPAISGANLTNVSATSLSGNPSINTTGIITATSFVGNGAGLTNVSAGKILQVKQSVKTDVASYSTGSSTVSDSYFDISGLSVTLTPSSGTKCLVSYTVNVGGENSYDAGIALFRGSTQIFLGDASGNRQRLSNYYVIDGGHKTYAANGQFLDTHGANGSTAVTYKLQMYVATPGRTTRVNRSHDDGDDRSSARLASQITVMEVAS